MTPGKHCPQSGLALPEFRYELPTTRERAMIFRQLFDSVSSTYSYLIASRRGGEALILDPVLEKVDRYIQLVNELDLRLVKAVDTHLHADHVTGLGALRDRTHCITVMGEQSKVDVVSMPVDEYVDLMNSLHLPNPKMMDVAVPANLRVGLAQEEIAKRGWAMSAEQAMALLGRADVALIDLRERREREKHGSIPGSLHAPYPDLVENIRPGGMLYELAAATGKRIVFYCAFGERSAMAVEAARQAGLAATLHIQGGLDAWKKADGPLTR